MRRIFCKFLQFAALGLACSIRAHSGPAPSGEMSFRLFRNYLIVVQGSVGTLEHLNFIVDTGTNITAIDRRIARKLGLTGIPGRIALFNHTTRVESSLIPSLQFGPLRAEAIHGAIQDLYPLEKALGVRIDAIVGSGVLARSGFIRIDYSSKKIIFGPTESSLRAVSFDTGVSGFAIRLQVQGEPVRLLVDTGAANMLLFECKLPRPLRQLQVRALNPSLNSAATEFETKEVSIPSVRLAASDFGTRKAFLINDDANCSRPFDGVVGPMSLGLQWMEFDFEHRKFSWKSATGNE